MVLFSHNIPYVGHLHIEICCGRVHVDFTRWRELQRIRRAYVERTKEILHGIVGDTHPG